MTCTPSSGEADGINSNFERDFDSRNSGDQIPQEEVFLTVRKARKFFVGCFGIFMVLFLIIWYAILAFVFEEASNGRDAVNWPTTSGQVVETKVTSHTSTSSSGTGSSRTTSSTTSYIPWVLYRYSVGALELENHTVQTMTTYETRAEAKLVTEEYPVSSTVTVYYKPSDPDKSVLVPGISDETQLVLNIFSYLPVILFAILVMFWAIKKARSSL